MLICSIQFSRRVEIIEGVVEITEEMVEEEEIDIQLNHKAGQMDIAVEMVDITQIRQLNNNVGKCLSNHAALFPNKNAKTYQNNPAMEPLDSNALR